jgi:signal transduction histidine kinase
VTATDGDTHGDISEAETAAELRQYVKWLADRYGRYEVTVDHVVADGDTAVVRWRLDEDEASHTALTEVTVGTDGIVAVAGDLEPAAVVPSATQAGLAAATRATDDPVVVLSAADEVVAVNDATLETFGRERAAVLGASVEKLLGPSPTFEAGEEYVLTGPFGDADGSDGATDRADRTLVARDVTERRRRTQQLSVLVRVLRHNVRNDLDVIRSRIDDARRRGDDAVAETLAAAATQTEELLETANTANTVQSLTASPDHHTADLVTVAREAADRARESFPDVTVVCETSVETGGVSGETAETPETAETSVADGFARAVWELVENACEHGGSTVRLSVSRHGQFWRLAVADDGPGIPDDERMVLNRAVETSLEHGSGLGLWLAEWVVDASGGVLAFAVDDGTVARIDLFDGDRLGGRDWPSETNS